MVDMPKSQSTIIDKQVLSLIGIVMIVFVVISLANSLGGKADGYLGAFATFKDVVKDSEIAGYDLSGKLFSWKSETNIILKIIFIVLRVISGFIITLFAPIYYLFAHLGFVLALLFVLGFALAVLHIIPNIPLNIK